MHVTDVIPIIFLLWFFHVMWGELRLYGNPFRTYCLLQFLIPMRIYLLVVVLPMKYFCVFLEWANIREVFFRTYCPLCSTVFVQWIHATEMFSKYRFDLYSVRSHAEAFEWAVCVGALWGGWLWCRIWNTNLSPLRTLQRPWPSTLSSLAMKVYHHHKALRPINHRQPWARHHPRKENFKKSNCLLLSTK